MENTHAVWILLVGLAALLAAGVNASSGRLRMPELVGYLVIGILLDTADMRWHVLGADGRRAFAFLADLGIVAILFHVGLRSDVRALRAKLRPAALIWISNVTVAALCGYLVARYAGGLEVLPSLVVAVALSATSIGVAAAAWEHEGALRSPLGQLMLDVVELDDLSGVALMALLFAWVPFLQGAPGDLAQVLTTAGLLFAAKFVAFAALCMLVARFGAPMLSSAVRGAQPSQRMLAFAGTGFIVAAVAGWLGFSLALGALFAGMALSRDSRAVRASTSFDNLYAFLAPFFFVGIGLQFDPAAFASAPALAAMLFAAAVLGKIAGTYPPARRVTGSQGAWLLGASMIPRAEIAMVIAHQAHLAGVLPANAYAALVVVAAGTCVAAPWLVHGVLARGTKDDVIRLKERRT